MPLVSESSFLFLCNADPVSFNIKPSDNSAMFIHVETRCFPLRRNMQESAQSRRRERKKAVYDKRRV